MSAELLSPSGIINNIMSLLDGVAIATQHEQHKQQETKAWASLISGSVNEDLACYFIRYAWLLLAQQRCQDAKELCAHVSLPQLNPTREAVYSFLRHDSRRIASLKSLCWDSSIIMLVNTAVHNYQMEHVKFINSHFKQISVQMAEELVGENAEPFLCSSGLYALDGEVFRRLVEPQTNSRNTVHEMQILSNALSLIEQGTKDVLSHNDNP